MIDRALSVLAAQLQEALAQRFGSGQTIAALGPVPDLSTQNPADQPVTLSLVRAEEERVNRAQVATRLRTDGKAEDIQPELRLNLFLLASVYAKGGYAEGLRYLSEVVGFFQSKPVFDHANTPVLDPGIDKLRVELCSPTFEEQNSLWGALMLRYVPSVMYRVRLVVVQDAGAERVVLPVRTIDSREVSA